MDFEAYLKHLELFRSCSSATLRSYRNDLAMFDRFASSRGVNRPEEMDHLFFVGFIEYMKKAPNPRKKTVGFSDATIARRIASVSGWLTFTIADQELQTRNRLKEFTARWKKNDQPKPIQPEALSLILANIQRERDRVLFRLFLATGLRVSEMAQLNRSSISFQQFPGRPTSPSAGPRHIGVGEVVGKGRKLRKFFVDSDTLVLLARYLTSRTDQHEALFLSSRGRRLSVRAIQHTLTMLCRRSGTNDINVHRFRHTFATNLANAEIDALVLMELMGHRNFATTKQYFKLTDKSLARGYHAAMEFSRGRFG